MNRSFIPGSPWVYYKIYTGNATSDYILRETIKPLTEKLIENKIIERWFFIRYSHPDNHIRIRFYCPHQENISLLIAKLYQPLKRYLEQDLIWKIELDTYEREIERYGDLTIELSEHLFFYDSELVVNLLDMLDGSVENEEVRWLFALSAVNEFLNSFKLEAVQKHILFEYLREGYGMEFGMNRFLKNQLDRKYRGKKKDIEFFINNLSCEEKYRSIHQILSERQKKINPLAEEILVKEPKFENEVNLFSFLQSHIHMHMNRMFASKNRLHELVCYDFLSRFYLSYIKKREMF